MKVLNALQFLPSEQNMKHILKCYLLLNMKCYLQIAGINPLSLEVAKNGILSKGEADKLSKCHRKVSNTEILYLEKHGLE